MDREAAVGVDDGCEEVDELLRLNCGWRRGRNFKNDFGTTVEGANAFPRSTIEGTKVVRSWEADNSGRTEAIVCLDTGRVKGPNGQ